jgi:hypothetical protein
MEEGGLKGGCFVQIIVGNCELGLVHVVLRLTVLQHISLRNLYFLAVGLSSKISCKSDCSWLVLSTVLVCLCSDEDGCLKSK